MDRSQLDYGVVSNRLKLFIGNGKRLPVSELFDFVPLICFTCHRTRTPEQITIGHDWVFRCLDRDDCEQHWPGHVKPPPPEEKTLSTSKHKYRVKKK